MKILLLTLLFFPFVIAIAQTKAQRDPNDSISRGKYIVENVAMCIECHTPRDDNGDLVTSRYLEGAPIPVSHVRSKCRKNPTPNITDRMMDEYVPQMQMRLRGKNRIQKGISQRNFERSASQR